MRGSDKLTQEILNAEGIPIEIDGVAGPETEFGSYAYAEISGGAAPGLDTVLRLVPPVSADPDRPLSSVVLAVARWYLSAGAREIGGNNRGPWIRRFMDGAEGEGAQWCNGFATMACLTEAESIRNAARLAAGRPGTAVAAQIRSGSCSVTHRRATAAGRLAARPSPGCLILFSGPGGWHHIGIVEVVDPRGRFLLTIEGNTPDPSDPGRSDRVARRIRRITPDLAFVSVD